MEKPGQMHISSGRQCDLSLWEIRICGFTGHVIQPDARHHGSVALVASMSPTSARSHNRRSRPCCQPPERCPARHAENLLNVIEALDDAELAALLAHLLDTHASTRRLWPRQRQTMPTPRRMVALRSSQMRPNPDGWNFSAAECNHNGTVRLVHFRESLCDPMRNHPDFRRIDSGLVRLLRNWFNPGFLVLEPIDWSTANILEKSSHMRRSRNHFMGRFARASHLRIGAVSLSFILPCPMSR